MNFSHQEGETIGLYAARLLQFVNKLKDAGVPIAEWYQSFQVIRYLPLELSGIVQSIYRWEVKKFIFNNVVNELIAEESRLEQCQSDCEFIALESKLDRNLSEKVKLVSNQCKKDIEKVRKCSGCETDSEEDYEISNHESSDEVKREVVTEITKEVETESLIEIKTENFDEADYLRTPLSELVWVREAAPRRDKSRTDIFYKVVIIFYCL
ncbi:hypothetical protein AVEN_139457-1 [Araneus ventricosus]|uniref:Uncharacterized protein n=1 Tax=Araneus ventricosus TaxID=182803 RepID=A0A4Y2IY85_ARAVE|nr:hypothetical protein AVEN_139457-1 [Araneus ventricosus]